MWRWGNCFLGWSVSPEGFFQRIFLGIVVTILLPVSSTLGADEVPSGDPFTLLMLYQVYCICWSGGNEGNYLVPGWFKYIWCGGNFCIEWSDSPNVLLQGDEFLECGNKYISWVFNPGAAEGLMGDPHALLLSAKVDCWHCVTCEGISS